MLIIKVAGISQEAFQVGGLNGKFKKTNHGNHQGS